MNQPFILRSITLCIVLLASTPGLAAEPMARLFMTPAERAGLDRLRLQGGVASVVEVSDAGPAGQLTLEGYARHSSGTATAWVNAGGGQPAQMVGAGRGAQRRGQPALVALRQSDGKTIALKVGQTYDRASHAVREQFEPAPAAPAARGQ